VGLHQIKKFLPIKRNNYQNLETTHRMGKKKILTSYSTDKGLTSRIYKELTKLKAKRAIIQINGK
jgi:hypothetical protein